MHTRTRWIHAVAALGLALAARAGGPCYILNDTGRAWQVTIEPTCAAPGEITLERLHSLTRERVAPEVSGMLPRAAGMAPLTILLPHGETVCVHGTHQNPEHVIPLLISQPTRGLEAAAVVACTLHYFPNLKGSYPFAPYLHAATAPARLPFGIKMLNDFNFKLIKRLAWNAPEGPEGLELPEPAAPPAEAAPGPAAPPAAGSEPATSSTCTIL